MEAETEKDRGPRVDPAGRPVEGRLRQAMQALGIVITWMLFLAIVIWATRGASPEIPPRFMLGLAILSLLSAEAVGGRRALVWPASAFAITGSISLGFAASMATPELRSVTPPEAIALISGTAALSMLFYLFRFRLPGLVSPIATFTIVALFLTLYGVDPASMARVEGLSPRGILAALMNSPLWAIVFGGLSLGAVILARRLDLKGDDFGVAAARPLHLIGGGILALVMGRALATYPFPTDLVTLLVVWVGACYWALRINRIAVLIAMHFAMTKPLLLAATAGTGWSPDLTEWMVIFLIVFVFDLAVWPRLHNLSLVSGWTLGPGGRVPRERDGWLWRYWPYA